MLFRCFSGFALLLRLCGGTALARTHRRDIARHMYKLTRSRIKPLVSAVVVRVLGQTAVMQQMIDALGNDAVNDREQRYADRHADKAEQAAEDQNGEHDPEARKAGRVAEDLRAEDVAVDLLKNDDEDNEVQRLKRTFDHDQDRARNSADKRAEEPG